MLHAQPRVGLVVVEALVPVRVTHEHAPLHVTHGNRRGVGPRACGDRDAPETAGLRVSGQHFNENFKNGLGFSYSTSGLILRLQWLSCTIFMKYCSV